MNNQQKLLILTAVVGVSAIGLLIILSRKKKSEEDVFREDGEAEMEFADLSAEESVASASETVVQVKVPRYAVGAIIGKGGQNIRQLKKDTGARLDFEREDESGEKKESKERILEIRGNRDRVRAAEIKVRQLIADQPPIVTIELSVPQESCGRIIGRGGETIREICQISGAKVLVERTPDRTKKGMRTVTIHGNTKQVEYAKGLVEEKVETEKAICARYRKMKQQAKHPSPSSQTKMKHPGKKLPDNDEYFEVFLSAFDVPNHIYVQLVTPESQRLDQLTQDMTEYYKNSDNSDDKQLVNGVKVGEIYCAPFDFDDLWYRACVMEINSTERTANLYYIDFGDNGTVSLDDLRVPKPEFLELEGQAIECYLSGLESKDGQWSEEAIKRFEELSQCAQWSVLMARKVGYLDTVSGRVTCLELIDTKQDEDVNLAETMIKEGFAVPSKMELNEASNDQIITGNDQTSNNNAVKSNKDSSEVPDVTSYGEQEKNEKQKRAIAEEEVIQSQEVMPSEEEIKAQEMMQTEEVIPEPEVVQIQEVKPKPEMTQNEPLIENGLTVKIVDEIPELEDIEAADLQLVENDQSKRLSADACSLSSTSTEDTVIHLIPKISDKGGSNLQSHIIDGTLQQTNEASKDTELPKDGEKTEVKSERSEVEGEMAQRSNGDMGSSDDKRSNDVGNEKQKVRAHQAKVNVEVNKWIENSSLEHDQEATVENGNEVTTDGSANNTSKSDTSHPARILFQNSLELSKENPIMLSDDEDSLSYMSARSELTIADTDTMSYKSAPDTPTNVESFEFPSQKDSSSDYDIITTPVGSDDESISTPAAFNAAKLEAATPVNVRTPTYQIRIVDESATPKQKGGSLETLSASNQDAGKLSSSPQRISKLSASTPQFGDLKSSQSRYGGSGSMFGKETSI